MTLDEIWAKAREMMGPNCRACPVCNGKACRGEVPGVGAMGDGSSWTACTEFLERVKIRMDTLHEPWTPEASVELFGVRLSAPVCLAPIGGMSHNYNGAINDEYWSNAAASGCKAAGVLAFTGDNALGVQFELGPRGHPRQRRLRRPDRQALAQQRQDNRQSRGLRRGRMPRRGLRRGHRRLRQHGLRRQRALRQVGCRPGRNSQEFAHPFIAKGVMTAEGAVKCAEAGCAGIIVSTHGGRVIASAQATAEVLPEIRAAVGSSLTVIVDGGIRTGADIFKVLALGADAAMIGRPFVVAAVGGSALGSGAEGVELYANTKRAELENLMIMTNSRTIGDITASKISLR